MLPSGSRASAARAHYIMLFACAPRALGLRGADAALQTPSSRRDAERHEDDGPPPPPRNIAAPPEAVFELTQEERDRVRENAPQVRNNGQRISFYAREREIEKAERRLLKQKQAEAYDHVPQRQALPEQGINVAGDRRGGRHERMAQWHPDEDAVLVQCVPLSSNPNRARPKWKEAARRIAVVAAASLGCDETAVVRTPKSVRCRWLRLRDGRRRYELTDGEPPEGTTWAKCSVCNKYKAGHICTGPPKRIEDIARERFEKKMRRQAQRMLEAMPASDGEEEETPGGLED